MPGPTYSRLSSTSSHALRYVWATLPQSYHLYSIFLVYTKDTHNVMRRELWYHHKQAGLTFVGLPISVGPRGAAAPRERGPAPQEPAAQKPGRQIHSVFDPANMDIIGLYEWIVVYVGGVAFCTLKAMRQYRADLSKTDRDNGWVSIHANPFSWPRARLTWPSRRSAAIGTRLGSRPHSARSVNIPTPCVRLYCHI